MLHYGKRLGGLPLLLRAYGSPFPRALPFGILSVVVTAVCVGVDDIQDSLRTSFLHPYPFQIYAFVIGFLVVLRTNHALHRYMEARTNVELMGSKWADVVVMCVAFDSFSTGDRASRWPWRKGRLVRNDGSEAFIARLVHLLSLLHAVALQHLRGDEELDNLVASKPRIDGGPDFLEKAKETPAESPRLAVASPNAPPPVGARSPNAERKDGDDDEKDGGASSDETNTPPGDLVDDPFAHAAEHNVNIDDDDGEKMFRRWASEKRHQHYKKGVYDRSSAFLVHAATADRRTERWTLPNLFMLSEGASEWIRCNESMPITVLGGVPDKEKKSLDLLVCNRAYLVLNWIQSLLIHRLESTPGLRVPAPIMSRVHQVMSDGTLGFNQADKMAKTPFPLPYAQMLTACLLVFNLFMPIVVAAHTNSMWLAVVIAFMSTMAYQGLNEVARELEDPFKPTHLNDLGLPLLQAEFNSKLRAASPPVGLSTPWLEE